MNFFNINNTFFTVLDYPMSYLEFFGTIAGGIAVWLSAKGNIWSWPIGIINVTLFFFLFYQVQLYPDMFLQIFFFVTNLMGWWRWSHPTALEENSKKELKVSFMSTRWMIAFVLVGMVGTVLLGAFSQRLHILFPSLFSLPSAFPYADSFVTVMSIVATYLMVQKKIECWLVWLVVDAVATYMYFVKGIKFVGIEYLVFCFIAAYGFYGWRKEYTQYQKV
jgi:nicotinamide mononucleotide transporter